MSKKKYILLVTIILIVFAICGVIGYLIINKESGEKETVSTGTEEVSTFTGDVINVNEWVNNTKSGVSVTVIAQTGCSHCQIYKPIMEEVQEEYGFKLYWFDIDELETKDYNTLVNTYQLAGYSGTPYTFVVKDEEVIDYLSGRKEKEDLESFLINSNVIQLEESVKTISDYNNLVQIFDKDNEKKFKLSYRIDNKNYELNIVRCEIDYEQCHEVSNEYNSVADNVLYFWKDMFFGYSWDTGGAQNIRIYDKDLNKVNNIGSMDKFQITKFTNDVNVAFYDDYIYIKYEYAYLGAYTFKYALENNEATYKDGIYTVLRGNGNINEGETFTKDTVIKYDLKVEYSGNNNLKQTKLNEVTLGEYLSTYGY